MWKHDKRVLGIFPLCVRRNGYLGASGQNSDLAVRSGDLDFLYDRCIFTTKWRLRDIFDVFVLLRRITLWPWPLTFWLWSKCTVLLVPDSHTNFDYPKTIGNGVWSHFRYLKQSLRMRSITWPVNRASPKHVTIFDPKLPIHYTTFMGLRWRFRGWYWSIPMLKRFSAAKTV